MFKSILVPVDLDEAETSKQALEQATELAKLSGGSIRLIYVRHYLPPSVWTLLPQSYDSDQQKDYASTLAKLAAEVPLPPDNISAVVRVGSVYKEVLDEANAVGADLIVIGSRLPSVSTYLLGSNASGIVRYATASVLVIR